MRFIFGQMNDTNECVIWMYMVLMVFAGIEFGYKLRYLGGEYFILRCFWMP
jgi:hypothetical protein